MKFDPANLLRGCGAQMPIMAFVEGLQGTHRTQDSHLQRDIAAKLRGWDKDGEKRLCDRRDRYMAANLPVPAEMSSQLTRIRMQQDMDAAADAARTAATAAPPDVLWRMRSEMRLTQAFENRKGASLPLRHVTEAMEDLRDISQVNVPGKSSAKGYSTAQKGTTHAAAGEAWQGGKNSPAVAGKGTGFPTSSAFAEQAKGSKGNMTKGKPDFSKGRNSTSAVAGRQVFFSGVLDGKKGGKPTYASKGDEPKGYSKGKHGCGKKGEHDMKGGQGMGHMKGKGYWQNEKGTAGKANATDWSQFQPTNNPSSAVAGAHPPRAPTAAVAAPPSAHAAARDAEREYWARIAKGQ